MAPATRRDSFCGKFSVMDVFFQYGLKFTILPPHTTAPSSKRFVEQVDYFDHPNTIGWVRLGDEAHENSGLACVITNGDDTAKRMCLGNLNANTAWREVTGAFPDPITLDEGGWADFPCRAGSLSVWVKG